MGIWDFISSGAESVKRNTPDLATPMTKVCKGTYYYSATAVKMIDNVVRVNGVQKLGQYIYMPDEEGRAKIVSFSTKFAKNASVYAIKESAKIFLPGLLPSHFTKSDFVINFQKKGKFDEQTMFSTFNFGRNLTSTLKNSFFFPSKIHM